MTGGSRGLDLAAVALVALATVGIGVYGLSPYEDRDAASLGLVPAMTLATRVAAVRRVPAGAGVSYGSTWRAVAPTTLALVPLGYADGDPPKRRPRMPLEDLVVYRG